MKLAHLSSRRNQVVASILILLWFVIACDGASQSSRLTTTEVPTSNNVYTTICARNQTPTQNNTANSSPNNADIGNGQEVWLGVSDADVEDLVQQVIQDPSINIHSLPDSLEVHIYRSTIKVVLDALYHMLGKIHGTQLPSTNHELQLKRYSVENRATSRKDIRQRYQKRVRDSDINENILQDVAQGLLSNRNINQRFLPDAIEKRLYINCLKLVFRLLEMIADSFKVTVCGHVVRMAISTATVETAMEQAAVTMADVDSSRLFEMARSVGLEDQKQSWWFPRKKQQFLRTLHASLLGLLLAILDDLMHRTRIELFSDRMVFDIVPSSEHHLINHEPDVTTPQKKQKKPLIPFLTGIVVGVAFSSLREELWNTMNRKQ